MVRGLRGENAHGLHFLVFFTAFGTKTWMASIQILPPILAIVVVKSLMIISSFA